MTITSASSCGASQADTQNNSSQSRADILALTSAVQSGDMNSAQQALAQLQQDSPRLAQALQSDNSDSDSPRISALKSLASAVQSGDVAGAQSALSKLQQAGATAAAAGAGAARGHHHHHHSAPPADPTATDPTADDTSTASGSIINVSA